MGKGYQFKRVQCADCGETLAENWLVRHRKAEHPKPVDDSVDVLVDDYDPATRARNERMIVGREMGMPCGSCGGTAGWICECQLKAGPEGPGEQTAFWKEQAESELQTRVLAQARLGMAQTRTTLSAQKVKAGLRHAAATEFQDYPEGTIEVGTALDAIDMLVQDVLNTLQRRYET